MMVLIFSVGGQWRVVLGFGAWGTVTVWNGAEQNEMVSSVKSTLNSIRRPGPWLFSADQLAVTLDHSEGFSAPQFPLM